MSDELLKGPGAGCLRQACSTVLMRRCFISCPALNWARRSKSAVLRQLQQEKKGRLSPKHPAHEEFEKLLQLRC